MQQSPEGTARSEASSGAGSADALAEGMRQQLVEVECLLRIPLKDAGSLDDARARVEASLNFDQALSALAAGAAHGGWLRQG